MTALERAIDIVGGQSELARRLGLKQANVWHWLNRSGRVPAEHVIAIEEATGAQVTRHDLRPDLYPSAAGGMALPEEELARGQLYGLIGRLLVRAPDQALLDALRGLPAGEGDIGRAMGDLATAAAATGEADAGREYHEVFVGLPRGEVMPYASYYLTGFLHEKPLARARADLARLGLERAEGVAEPEDHLGQLCETMSLLICGPEERRRDLPTQEKFFNAHLAAWAARCFADIERAPSARLYEPLGRLGRAFMSIEGQAFKLAA